MTTLSTKPNRAYPAIPAVSDDVSTHTNALQQIRESLETHERRNANYLKSFIRFEELVTLGLITADGALSDGVIGPPGSPFDLDDLKDVTITSVGDGDILAYSTSAKEWINQTAAELGLSEVGHTHSGGGGGGATELNDLTDVNTNGAHVYDLLYRKSNGKWVDTDAALQFDGTDFFIPSGDLSFYSEGAAAGAAIRKDTPGAGDLTIQVPGGDFVVDPTGDFSMSPGGQVLVDSSNIIMDSARGVRWNPASGSSALFLALQADDFFVGDPVYDTVIDGLTIALNSDTTVAGDIIVTGTVDGRDVAADGSAQDTHIADAVIHITSGERTNWDTAYGWGDHGTYNYADDGNVVHLTGDETVAGEKTFTNRLFASSIAKNQYGTEILAIKSASEFGYYGDIFIGGEAITIQEMENDLGRVGISGYYSNDGTIKLQVNGKSHFTGNLTTDALIDGRDVAADGTAQDNHIADATLHFTEASINHDALTNYVADEHIAEASLSIAETQIPDGSLLARLADNETITGAWESTATFTIDGAASEQLKIKSNAPTIWFYEKDEATLNQNWYMGAIGGVFVARAYNDTFTASDEWLSVVRTDVNIDSIALKADALTVAAVATFTSAPIIDVGTNNNFIRGGSDDTQDFAILFGNSYDATIAPSIRGFPNGSAHANAKDLLLTVPAGGEIILTAGAASGQVTYGANINLIDCGANARLETAPSQAGYAGFNIPTGTAPTSPVHGDVWVTATDFVGRINGVDYSLIAGSGSGFVDTTGTPAVGQVAVFTDADTLEGDADLYWDSGNGRLGIGTTSPSELLHVSGGSSLVENDAGNAFMYASFKNSAGYYGEFQFQQEGTARWSLGADNNSFYVYNYTNADYPLYVNKSDSFVGINKISPTAQLHVESTGTDIGIYVKSELQPFTIESTSATQNTPLFNLYHNKTGAVGDEIGFNFQGKNDAAAKKGYANLFAYVTNAAAGSESGAIHFETKLNGSIATNVVIDDSGYLGVNTTSPTEWLHVVGNAKIEGTATVKHDGAQVAVGYNIIPLADENTASFTLGAEHAGGGIDITGANTCAITIPASGTTAFPIRSVCTILNNSTGSVTITDGTATCYAFDGTAWTDIAGSATLAKGMYTLYRRADAEWFLDGSGAIT